MQYTMADVRRMVGALPRIRPVALPLKGSNGCIIACRDENHIREVAPGIIAQSAIAPIFVALGLADHNKKLGDEIGARVLKISRIHSHLARELIVMVGPGTLRRDVLKLTKAAQAAGRAAFYFSAVPVPESGARPKFLANNGDKILETINHLADQESVVCYLSRIKSIMTGDSGYQAISDYPQYLHPVVKAEAGDIVCEGGTGPNATTTRMFSRKVGETGKVYAFEPVGSNFARAAAKTAEHPNIILEKFGLWSEKGEMEIKIAEQVSTLMDVPKHRDKPTEICQLVSIDSYFANANAKPSLIKLDIEGAEENALVGAEQVIKEMRPKLQICLYHSLYHFLDFPIKFIRQNYRIYIGHHTPFMNECLMYAVAQ